MSALVCSSVDTLQSAIAATIVNDIFSNKISLNWARVIALLLNVPAIVVAALNLNVFTLFLIADLIAAVIVLPVVLGLVTPLNKFLTGTDFVVGTLGGLFSVVILGWSLQGSVAYGFQLLSLPNQIFVPGESIGVFLVGPIGSVVFMFLSAFVRRVALKALGRNPDEQVTKPELMAGPGQGLPSIGHKNELSVETCL
jgi:hypothetical protein